MNVVSQCLTLYLSLPATQGGKGQAHTNRANGSGLVEEIKRISSKMARAKNDLCASDICTTNVGLASLTMTYQ